VVAFSARMFFVEYKAGVEKTKGCFDMKQPFNRVEHQADALSNVSFTRNFLPDKSHILMVSTGFSIISDI